MPLFTQADQLILDGVQFIQHYAANRWGYLQEGKHTYRALSISGVQLLPVQLTIMLSARLQTCPLFVTKLKHDRPFAYSSVYGYWAVPLARYMLDNDWVDIIRP